MSKSDIGSLLQPLRQWAATFIGTLELTPTYTQFVTKCYKELIAGGMPSAEASIIATELLKIHLQQWYAKKAPPSDTTLLDILKTFKPQQGQ